MLKRIAVSLLAIVVCVVGLMAQEANFAPQGQHPSNIDQITGIDTIQYLQDVVVYGNKPYGNVIP